MGSRLTQNEVDYIQKLFSDFIKRDGPSRPFPPLAEGMFRIFEAHYDVIEPLLDELKKKEYSSEQFGAYFPFLVEITSMESNEVEVLREKIGGSQRYLVKPMSLFDRTYLICKEFYLDQDDKGANKKRLYKWFCKTFDIEERTDLLEYSKSLSPAQNNNQNKLIDTFYMESNSDSHIVNQMSPLYQSEIKRLEAILNGATFTLYNVEKENICKLIKSYQSNDEINDELKDTVEKIIVRLKRVKTELSNLEL